MSTVAEVEAGAAWPPWCHTPAPTAVTRTVPAILMTMPIVRVRGVTVVYLLRRVDERMERTVWAAWPCSSVEVDVD